MREISIGKNEAGQRLDKFLKKYLRCATGGFIYRMLRKKNIKLNGKRAEGREILHVQDVVAMYFSEETFQKFCGDLPAETYPVTDLDILYEDEDIALINKPAGLLSQKGRPSDVSLVEYFLGYLQRSGAWSMAGTFTPAICNRLDRNTSGIVVAGKSLAGLQEMSRLLKERRLAKFYLTIVEGVMDRPQKLRGYLRKDERKNRVQIYEEDGPGRQFVLTGYEPIRNNGRYTLLQVELITGKSHQIRAHLGSVGHPLLGDVKYGGSPFQGRRGYLLHAWRLIFPSMPEEFGRLSGRVFEAPLPQDFQRIKEKLFGKDEI